MRDYKSEFEKRVEFIKSVLAESGAKGIVYGNSGGKDSALVGILCKAACDNTIGIIMPCTSKRNYDEDSGAEAKSLMDSESGYIIIDARTQSEFDEWHIPGAILIPEYEIAERAESELSDKNQLILVYCRSGRRSKIAAEELVKPGYTNVKEFGGIIDWKYETVK